MNRKQKIQIGIVVCLAIYSLVGFIIIPLVVKSMLPEKLGAALNREVLLKDVSLNPYTLRLTLEGLEAKKKNSEHDFISFDRLMVNIQASSLFKTGLVISEITLEKPFISIDRVSDTRFNFSDLIEEKVEKEKTAAESPPSEPFQFELSDIRIVDGRINVWDAVIKRAHNIKDISFNVPFLSNFQKHHDTHTKPGFTIQLNDAKITADISTKPFADSLETILDIKINGIRLPHYFDYAPQDLGFEITNGTLDMHAKIFFTRTKNKEMTSKTSGTVDVHDLEIVDSGKHAMVRLPKLAVVFAQSKFLKKDVRIESITVSRPEIDIRRNESGEINILSMGQPAPKDDVGPKTPSGPESKETKDAFRLVLNDLKMDSAWVRFHDEYVGNTSEKQTPPVQIAMGPIQLGVQNFSTDQDSKGSYDFKTRLNEKGDIAANGQFGIFPLSMDTHFDFKDVVFTWIEPYLQGNVHLAITNGRFSSSGDLTLTQDKTEGLSATLKGDASIENLETVDKFYAEDFASLQGFHLKKMDISYNPMRIELGEILLNGWKNRVVLHEDGNLNLSKVVVSKNGSDNGSTADHKNVKPPAKASVIPIKVGTVSMQNIHMDFIDQQIKPNFSSNLTISEAKITGLTSKEFKEADVVIKGKVDDYAPVNVTGKINPLQEDLFADMTFALGGMELTTLTPYSGKYIGNAIEKGKLSLDLSCLIEKKALKADDKIVFDQLALGKAVESPDSLNLPVGLAISLLQDRNGQINLDVPVSGRLDDPEFSLGGVILQTLINIVEKAATSPFTLIAGVAGGGEELQFIEFDAGHEKINDESSKKLDSITTLLYERPGLSLGITGYVDPLKDRERLLDMIFLKKVNAQKRLALIQKGINSKPLEDIDVSPDEYEEYLKRAYTVETSLKPGDEITIQEMKDTIKERTVLNDMNLKTLALQRAKEVKAYILEENTIEPNRLFLTEAATLAPEQKNDFSKSRVELSLK